MDRAEYCSAHYDLGISRKSLFFRFPELIDQRRNRKRQQEKDTKITKNSKLVIMLTFWNKNLPDYQKRKRSHQ